MRSDRAQLVLVGAITVAIAILGAVILLNTIHSSPEATAETDTRSIAEAEKTLTEIEHGLERVAVNETFATKTDDFDFSFAGDAASLENSTEAYEEQYLNLTTIDRAGITSIGYSTTESTEGTVAINESVSTNSYQNDKIIDGADGLAINITVIDIDDDSNVNIASIDGGGGDDDLDLRPQQNEIRGWGFDCDLDFENDVPFEIIMSDGEGEIRPLGTENALCSNTYTILESASEFEFNNLSPAGTLDLEYEIISFGGECSEETEDNECIENAVLEPAFDVTFQNPNVAVDSQIRLWEDE